MFGIPNDYKEKKLWLSKRLRRVTSFYATSNLSRIEKTWSVMTFFLGTFSLLFVIALASAPVQKFISPLVAQLTTLTPLKESKTGYEVFGFAPYWTINKLENVDFDALTTLAYFDVPVDANGDLDRTSQGYITFKSDKATELFKKAHEHGTRVALTITIMDNYIIESFLLSPEARSNAIEQTVSEVKKRGIDGINVDVEYVGTPSEEVRNNFSVFVKDITNRMHEEVPGSRVTVSVYASSARSPKLYDIGAIGNSSDGIFMMAYDFSVKGSDLATPTAPLYGHKEGKYSYDISTAVEDFTKVMPANKLIMGVPYYGYSWLIYGEPRVKAETRPMDSWRGRPLTQTYEIVQENDTPDQEGWDELGQVGWKAYYEAESDTWRMIFLDDAKSLGVKYDFAKEKGLAGVGMWALGFDNGRTELWSLVREKFGTKNLADNSIKLAEIN